MTMPHAWPSNPYVFLAGFVAALVFQPERAIAQDPPTETHAPARNPITVPASPTTRPHPGELEAHANPTPMLPGDPLLVTIAAFLQPAQPIAGQKIEVHAIVTNQAGPPSLNGLGFFVFCDDLPGKPKCPGTSFASPMPSIAHGESVNVVVPLDADWPPGEYRIVAGTDVLGVEDVVELKLMVKSAPYGGIRMREGEVRQESDPGQAQGLNPQPEPPSAQGMRISPSGRGSAHAGAAVQAFAAPTWSGKRVDLCLVWGGQCGEPAAAEFCERSGYAKTTAWKPANDIGAETPTVVLSSGQVCSDASCDGFASISCSQ